MYGFALLLGIAGVIILVIAAALFAGAGAAAPATSRKVRGWAQACTLIGGLCLAASYSIWNGETY